MCLKGYAVGTRKHPHVGQIQAVLSDTSRKETMKIQTDTDNFKDHVHVLIVGEDSKVVANLRDILEQHNYEVSTASKGSDVFSQILDEVPNVIVLDPQVSQRQISGGPRVTENLHPLTGEMPLPEKDQAREMLKGDYNNIIGESAQTIDVLHSIEIFANSPTTVLISGETGTGKELVAHSLHENSSRSKQEMIILNCAEISEQLMESELFGHEKGAFTGADRQHKGLFEMANGSTLFLDEIGELPIYLQPTLTPGFTSMRDIGRFSIFTALFLCILAGAGTLWLSQRVGPRFRLPFTILLISVILLELWPSPPILMKVPRYLDELPRIYERVKKLSNDTVLLELPMRGDDYSGRYLYHSIFHWLPLVNGYSGFSPRAYAQLGRQLEEAETEKGFLALKAYDVDFILAHWDDLTNLEKDRLRELEKNGKIKQVEREENKVLYQLDDRFTQLSTPRAENLSFAIYESRQGKANVTLCLYYQVDEGKSFLVTPWQNKIECEVNWYVDSGTTREGSEPLLTRKISYQNSALMLPGKNVVEIDMSAPPPGRYKVLVRPRNSFDSVEMFGRCELKPHGFVRFEPEE